MKLTTLGGLKLDDSDFVRAKPLLLLTYLVLEGAKDRRHLAELFWPDAVDPLNSLAAALKQLRRYVPGAVEGGHTRVSSAVGCDATTFLQLSEAARYEEALNLYQGPFLSGIHLPGWGAELEEWVYGTREFLAVRARSALLRLGEGVAATGKFEEASKYAETAYLLPGAPEPEPEELTRLHALLAAGHSPHLGKLRKDAQDFGIKLSPSSMEAQEQLQRHPTAPSLGISGQGLPTRGTSFIGRDVELIEITNRLNRPECSLLTLTGLGGVGKSRLAVRVAKDLGERFLDGIYFISLEALSDVNLISSSIAAVLGVPLQGSEDPLGQVTRHIGKRVMLLVLDNYEHLLEGTVIVTLLLRTCPNLKLLVTSRERLNLEEEWVLPLEGFAMPTETVALSDSAHHDALRLFEERAKRARLSFKLTLQELPYVVSICHQVQGLPLGIELAAAWVKLLSCQEIAEEVKRTTDFLSATSRNVTERHKSIRAVFEGSWRLLTSKEQEMLKRLSVFQGGFRREAAAEVSGATIPVLASLTDKSLLRVTDSGRYHLHPLIQQYIWERLLEQRQEQLRTQEKHVRYYLALAEQAEVQLRGPEQTRWLECLDEEHDNLRAAMDWTEASGQAELGQRLAGAVRPFWEYRNHLHEGRERMSRLLSQPGATERTLTRAKALDSAGRLVRTQADYASARPLFEESLTIYRELGDKWGVANSLRDLGFLAFYQADYASARPLLEESLAIRRALGDRWSVANSQQELGFLALLQASEYASVRLLFEESLAIHRELGSRWGVATSLQGLGILALDQADHASARPLLEQSLAIYRELGDKWGVANSLQGLGVLASEEADYASARSLLEESLAIRRMLGDKWGLAGLVEEFAVLRAGEGKPEQAARLWGAAEALRRSIGAPLPPREYHRQEKYVAAGSVQLGEAAFRAAWGEGRMMPFEGVIICALEV